MINPKAVILTAFFVTACLTMAILGYAGAAVGFVIAFLCYAVYAVI